MYVVNTNKRLLYVHIFSITSRPKLIFVFRTFYMLGKADGTYPDPSDCSNYHQCYGGVQYDFRCPAGLLFNKEAKICDWPANVTC